jgi:hypothetical protein
LAELDRYDAASASAVATVARSEVGLEDWVLRYRKLYRELIDEPATASMDGALAWAHHLQLWSPSYSSEWPWVLERGELLSEVRQLRQEVDLLRSGMERPEPGVALSVRDASRVRLSGFHAVEDWGAWSRDRFCSARLRPPTGFRGGSVELVYRTLGGADFAIEVFANGLPIGTTSGGAPVNRAVTFDVSEAATDADDLWLSFRTGAPCSPRSLGLGEDDRELGFGLSTLTLTLQ